VLELPHALSSICRIRASPKKALMDRVSVSVQSYGPPSGWRPKVDCEITLCSTGHEGLNRCKANHLPVGGFRRRRRKRRRAGDDKSASGWCLKEFNLAHRLNKRLFGILIEDIPVVDRPINLTSTWQTVALARGRDHVMLRATMPVTGEEVHVTSKLRVIA
jgi:hypothetical protein